MDEYNLFHDLTKRYKIDTIVDYEWDSILKPLGLDHVYALPKETYRETADRIRQILRPIAMKIRLRMQDDGCSCHHFFMRWDSKYRGFFSGESVSVLDVDLLTEARAEITAEDNAQAVESLKQSNT